MVKRVVLVVVILLVVALLTSCAPGPNTAAAQGDDAAGFWQGLWHGIIVPVTFFISLFKDDVSVYEVVNNGGWYDAGFLFGFSALWGGSGGGAAARRKRRKSC